MVLILISSTAKAEIYATFFLLRHSFNVIALFLCVFMHEKAAVHHDLKLISFNLMRGRETLDLRELGIDCREKLEAQDT